MTTIALHGGPADGEFMIEGNPLLIGSDYIVRTLRGTQLIYRIRTAPQREVQLAQFILEEPVVTAHG